MVSRKRSVQARHQKRDDRGQFQRASPTPSDSAGGDSGDSNDNGRAGSRPPVKKCGHRYCISTSSDSSDNTVWQQVTGPSSSEGSGGGERKIRGQAQCTPPHVQSGRASPSSDSSGGPVRTKGSQWRSAPTGRGYRRASSSSASTKQKGKEKATGQGPLENAWTLHHQVAESDSRINMLVGQLKIEKAKNKALQRALLEASKKASK